MVGSASLVGRACLAAGTQRLIQIGSIAALYLGDPGETITGATPPDPRAEGRADYARGKAASDLALLELHRTEGLPVCILRPGVVVGEGTSPFHSGLGFYNNEQYCQCKVETMDMELGSDAEIVWELKLALAEGGTRKLQTVAMDHGIDLDDEGDETLYKELMQASEAAERIATSYCADQR